MTTLNKDALTAKYIQLRDQVAEIEARTKAETAPLKEVMGKIELYFKGLAAEEGVESWKTVHGTVYLSRTDTVRLADPSSFMDYVIAHEAWDLIEKRASKTGVRSFIDTNHILPPGAEMSTKVEVNVRRPTST